MLMCLLLLYHEPINMTSMLSQLSHSLNHFPFKHHIKSCISINSLLSSSPPASMKRFMSDQMDITNMAGSLMLLSQDGGAEDRHHSGQPSAAGARVFECKTCKRQFPSFQALGGHRASHKKPRVVGDGGANGPGHGRPRVHECSVCGLEFAIGQALGGHMRRHRAEGGGFGHGHGHGHGLSGGEKKRVWLDLNLPPSENEMECRKKMGFGIEIVDNIPIPMVDCFH